MVGATNMTQVRRKIGFTLIELLVVLAVIATLLTLALPRYFSSLEKSREAVLQQNLALLRESLDQYYGDKGRYPDALDELVDHKYLRSLPVDPITDSNETWVKVPPEQPDMGGIYDVRSGAHGVARDGTEYQNW
jgi:general secretion pathway protein G